MSDSQHCTLGKDINGTKPIYDPPNPWNCSGDYARRSWLPFDGALRDVGK
jgi:hypothetical protein